MKKFYITTAIPYVNSKPHIGHALEFVQTDVIARFHKLIGDKVCLLSGSDENAVKNIQAAQKAGINIQSFIDNNAFLFQNLAKKLNVGIDVFQKGSDPKKHFISSQLLWNLCDKNGDIYKKSYKGLYCVGCETFYTSGELDEKGECLEHPGKKLEHVSETNYFFRLSKYQNKLIQLIESDTLLIIPEIRKNEVLSFLKQKLKDISVSRSNERAKNWGVPVPNDQTQRIYVWFDALNIYQSGIGFGWNDSNYQKWWPADVHVIGKGISRFHAVYWPAFLISAGLKIPKSLFIHGYLTINGQKMSKTLGNIVDPLDIINKYGVDPLRYYLLREIPSYGDGDFSERRFKELYNSDLANGLGNLVARIARLGENAKINSPSDGLNSKTNRKIDDYKEYINLMNKFKFNEVLVWIWDKVTEQNKYIDEKQPWKLSGLELEKTLKESIKKIQEIAFLLQPFMPETSVKISNQFNAAKIISHPPLFPRIK
jgi:methionyl-tRNA synthetase